MTLPKPPVAILVLLAVIGSAAVQAADFALIESLPARLATLRAKAAKVWESGSTSDIRDGSLMYAKGLEEMMIDLGKGYYPNGQFSAERVKQYVEALHTVARM